MTDQSVSFCETDMAPMTTTRAERRKARRPAQGTGKAHGPGKVRIPAKAHGPGKSQTQSKAQRAGKAHTSRKGRGPGEVQSQILRRGASRPRSRAERQAQRREAILAAALEEFSARGFAATRLDDIARRATVAKGTIYLYFRDKESLFQELVRAMLSPIVGRLQAAPMADLPPRMVAEAIADVFVREIFGTRRQDVIRLIITEGHRFPKLADVYYHEVIRHVVPVVRGLMARAAARGELPNDALARFPQLLVAPALVALVWNGLFNRFAPLDVGELLRAHITVLFGERSAT
jgi:AcrR family transcriptional regulator